MSYMHKTVDSPVGRLKLVASAKGLSAILWENDGLRDTFPNSVQHPEHPTLLQTEMQLAEYFNGERKTFSIPLEPIGTEFQQQVWRALRAIPFGETKSYIEIAKQIGNPNASRAVGAANGKNPIAIVVPCHRVIGASGKLTGFAGGLEAKAFLLALEQSKGH